MYIYSSSSQQKILRRQLLAANKKIWNLNLKYQVFFQRYGVLNFFSKNSRRVEKIKLNEITRLLIIIILIVF